MAGQPPALFQVPLSSLSFYSHVHSRIPSQPAVSPVNCGIVSMRLLGVLTAADADRMTQTSASTNIPSWVPLLDRMFPGRVHSEEALIGSRARLESIAAQLAPGMGTLMLTRALGREYGHFYVLKKDEQGTLGIFDAQMGYEANGIDGVIHYIEQGAHNNRTLDGLIMSVIRVRQAPDAMELDSGPAGTGGVAVAARPSTAFGRAAVVEQAQQRSSALAGVQGGLSPLLVSIISGPRAARPAAAPFSFGAPAPQGAASAWLANAQPRAPAPAPAPQPSFGAPAGSHPMFGGPAPVAAAPSYFQSAFIPMAAPLAPQPSFASAFGAPPPAAAPSAFAPAPRPPSAASAWLANAQPPRRRHNGGKRAIRPSSLPTRRAGRSSSSRRRRYTHRQRASRTGKGDYRSTRMSRKV